MSFQAMTWAVEQELPDAQSKLLLLMIANHSGLHETDRHTCWPSIRLLARECSMSEDTVIRRLKVLSKMGLVLVSPRSGPDGKQTSNLYKLPIPEKKYEAAASSYPRRYPSDPLPAGSDPTAGSHPPPAGSDPVPPLAAVQTSNTNQSMNHISTHLGKGSLEEVKEYCLAAGLPASDGEWFFHKCEGNGWTNGGKPIKNWRATIRAWQAAGYMASQRNKSFSINKESASQATQRILKGL